MVDPAAQFDAFHRLSNAWSIRCGAVRVLDELRYQALRVSADRAGVQLLKLRAMGADGRLLMQGSDGAFERRFDGKFDRAIDNVAAQDEALPRSLTRLPAAEESWQNSVIIYDALETRHFQVMMKDGEVREKVELLLGSRPTDREAAEKWDDGAKAYLADDTLGEASFSRLDDGRQAQAARRVARAQSANGIHVNGPKMPPLAQLSAAKHEAALEMMGTRWDVDWAVPDSVAFSEQVAALSNQASADLEKGRSAAQKFVLMREPEEVVHYLGRPAETPEDLSLWVPAAAACLEALTIMGPARVNKAMKLLDNEATHTEYQRLAKAAARWLWWKAPAAELTDFHTAFDLVTSNHATNNLYLDPGRGATDTGLDR